MNFIFICGIIVATLGLVLIIFKMSWLIAGYNTLSDEEKRKRKLNDRSISTRVGIAFLIVGIAICFISFFYH